MSSTGAIPSGTLVAGRYQVQEPLAGEGSAAVYRAVDTRLDRPVALRALPAAEAGGAQQGKAAARLVHPNVARVLDFGSDTELALEFVVADLGTGGSLAALLAQRGVPPLPLAMRMVQEAAAGLAAAHRAGLVHGDLHPGVLWLSRDEGRLQVRVLGLGLNPVGSPPPRATARYAAPERLRRSRELTTATDVFSLGVIAYEVFAGLPAEWTQLLLQMARGQAVVAPSLLETRPDLPAHVAHAVRRALMSDPASRWPDAGELAAHLIADLAAQPAEAPAAVAVPAIVAAPPAVETTAETFAERLVEAIGPEDEQGTDPVTISESEPSPAVAEAAPADEAPVSASVDAVPVSAPAIVEASPVVIAAAPAVVPEPEPVVAEAASASVPEPEPIIAGATPAIVAEPAPVVEAAPVATAAAAVEVPAVAEAPAPPAEPIIADAAAEPAPAEAPKPARQPLTAGRRAKPIALASTDLADTLYIPPALEKPSAARPAASAAPAEKPAPAAVTPPADKVVAPPAAVASAPAAPKPEAKPEPVASRPEPVAAAPEAALVATPAPKADARPEPVTAPVFTLKPETTTAAADDTVAMAAYVPAPVESAPSVVAQQDPNAPISLPERRRNGLARLGGAPSTGHKRGLIAASIAVAVLVGGGVVAKTLLARPGSTTPQVAQSLTSQATAALGTAPAAAQPQALPTDSAAAAVVLPPVAPADTAGLTAAEKRKQEEDRRRLEEQRRLQQRQQDSLRQVQLAAAAQPVVPAPQQVALQNAPRPTPGVPAPQMDRPVAPTVSAPAPAAAAPARPAAADPNRVYSAEELDARPSLANAQAFRSAVSRSYPSALEGTSTWGSAVVSFVVRPDGSVDRSTISVVEASHPAFRNAATTAISRARFTPARVGGQAVRTQVSMPITWRGGAQDDDE